MITAMHENGGNVFQRHLDGHPELLVYPFESQLGTRYVVDELLSLFPFKYRWPEFTTEGNPEQDFELFYDEEVKTRLRRPGGSKFRSVDLQMVEAERKSLFVEHMHGKPRTRSNLVSAFFHATFESWKNLSRSGKEKFWVGYSPIIGVDAEKILTDFPDGYVLHIVRNPLACFAETCRRPYPLPLKRYAWTWSFVQYNGLVFTQKFPGRYIVIKYEDLMMKKEETMLRLAEKIGISFNESMMYPSWNGGKLENMYPWGTIDLANPEEQQQRIQELSNHQVTEIRQITGYMVQALGYEI